MEYTFEHFPVVFTTFTVYRLFRLSWWRDMLVLRRCLPAISSLCNTICQRSNVRTVRRHGMVTSVMSWGW